MDIEITKDSDYLICSLYKAYLQKRSNGMNKIQASSMGGSEEYRKNSFLIGLLKTLTLLVVNYIEQNYYIVSSPMILYMNLCLATKL